MSEETGEDRPENLRHVGGPFYVVRTQAGFRRALKQFFGRVPERLEGHPTSYPSLICLSTGYSGYMFARADCMHVTDVALALVETAITRTHVKFKLSQSGGGLGNRPVVVLEAKREVLFKHLMAQEIHKLESIDQLSVVPDPDQRVVQILHGWPYRVIITVQRVSGPAQYRVGYTDGPVTD
jgi:hypothetical protein